MNGNGRRRLERVEERLEPPSNDEAAFARAWDSAATTLLSTMSPAHVQGLGLEMQQREHPDPSRPYGRLWAEFHARLVEKVGVAPGQPPRYPDAPLALPVGLAVAYLQGGPNFSPGGARCSSCGLRLPASGENIVVVSSGDGWHFRDTGEPAPTPALPHIAGERVMWRALVLFTACPLCGGLMPAWKAEAAGDAPMSSG